MMLDLRTLGTTDAGPRGVHRVLQILGHLARHPQGRTLSQLCEDLQLPKTTLFSMLKTLVVSGHLQLDARVYRLGPPSVALGQQMAQSARLNFPDCAREALQSLCRRTGETAILGMLTADGMHCQYVSVVESEHWLRFSVKLDSLKPSYATGTGHAMLAYLPQDELQAVLTRVKFEKITSKTVQSRRALLAALRQVRESHYSLTDSGTVAGVTSIAAPVFDGTRRVMAAVSAGGPSSRMTPNLGAIQRVVRGTAQDISEMLGFTGEYPPPVSRPTD